MKRKVLHLAVPNIVSNITVPLVGIVDMAIAGRLSQHGCIAAIAVGTTIFNFLYWNFGFLRMGTSGFASQAFGAGDVRETARVLIRSLFVALLFSSMILLLRNPIRILSFKLVTISDGAEKFACNYYMARIWAAPAVLAVYTLKGWFIGMQNPKIAMWMAIIINGVNILMSILLAFNCGMGIYGIGLGSAIGQYCGVLFAITVLVFRYRSVFSRDVLRHLFAIEPLVRFFKVNSDIFIRTLCLLAVFTYFTIASSYFGDEYLEANAILLQLFTIFSYFMDGFAYAVESLAGRYFGAGDHRLLKSAVRNSFFWGVCLSAFVMLLYALFTESFLSLFNPEQSVLQLALRYKWYIVMVPAACFVAFLLDGVLVGLTASRIMRNTILLSSLSFFLLYFLLRDNLGNHSIWIALLVFLFLRSILQLLLSRKLIFNSAGHDDSVM